jgi:hypothetical protein
VREDDAEPELLDDEGHALEEGAVVAMAVKELPLLWQTFPDECVELSEGGAVATEIKDPGDLVLVTTGTELTEGRHFWEVEILPGSMDDIFVGVTRPNLDPVGDYAVADCTDAWFIEAHFGALWGNGKANDDAADAAGSCYEQGDRVGVLLDLNNGSLLFFKNGVQHGPGYAAGSVSGPVVVAVQMADVDEAVRLHAGVAFPAGHVQ